MRRLFVTAMIAGWLVCAGRSARADSVDFVEIAREAPSAEAFPDADGLYLLIDQDVRIGEDGREILTLRRAVKIFTNQGRLEFSDYRFPYDAETQTVRVRTARSVRKDFRTLDVEKDAINDITPPELAGAAVYSNALERVFSYPAAVKGSVLVLELERESARGDSALFGASVPFGFSHPARSAGLTLSVPAGTPVVCAELNGVPGPGVTQQGGWTTYDWRMKDVPRIVRESFMPPMDAVAPRVVFSATDDWGRVAAEFARGFYQAVVLDDGLASAVDEWVRGLRTGEEKTREIFLRIVREIRCVDLELGRGGYKPNAAPEVFHNRYGDCRDKAVLLIAALSRAGVKAYPVLYDDRRIDLVETVPTLRQFNNLMVAVEEPSGRRMLDPMAEHCLYGFCPEGGGNRGLLVKPRGHEIITIPETPCDQSFSEKALSVKIRADGSAEGRAECSLGGHFDRRARIELAEMTGRERDREFARAVNRLSEGASLGQVSVSDLADLTAAASVSLSFSADGFARVQGRMMILRLPDFPLHFANTPAYPGLETRKFDFVVESGFRESYRVELEIPRGYETIYVPAACSVETPLGRWEVTAAADARHGLITIERRVLVRQPRIPVEAYAEFKAAFDAVSSPKNALVLLEKKG